MRELTTADRIGSVRAGWLKLRSLQARTPPSADPDRFLATLTAMKDAAPYIAVLGGSDSPSAMVIARIQRRSSQRSLGYLRFGTPNLRYLDVVYGGLLTDLRPESCLQVSQHLQSLLDRGYIDCVAINHLPVRDPMFSALHARRMLIAPPEAHWRLLLHPDGYEKTIAGFSKKHRYNMRRCERQLRDHFNGHVRLRVFTRGPEEFAPGADRVAASTYQFAMGVGFRDSAVWRAILESEACQARMRCYWLECEGEPIAFQAGCVYGDTYFLEAIGYLPEHQRLSPGTVLLLLVLQDLCSEGIGAVDYGFGHADYKEIYGTESWEERTVLLYGSGLRLATCIGMERCFTVLDGMAKRGAERLGLLRKVKSLWRSRLRRSP